MTYGFVAKRHLVQLACLAAVGAASAQTAPGPWACGTEMYVGRTGNDVATKELTTLFRYNMDNWAEHGTLGETLGPVGAGGEGKVKNDLNALAYNPRDNYLYAMKRVTAAVQGPNRRVGLYRIGRVNEKTPALVTLSPTRSSYKDALYVRFVDTAGVDVPKKETLNGAAAAFDRYGNYFMVNGANNKLYRM